MQHKDVFLLETIVEFCDRIISSTASTDLDYAAFETNLDLVDSCAFRIEQIGENVKDLSETFKTQNPKMEWHKIVSFRNIIAHAYGTINTRILWNIVCEDIPKLRNFCAKSIGLNY